MKHSPYMPDQDFRRSDDAALLRLLDWAVVIAISGLTAILLRVFG